MKDLKKFLQKVFKNLSYNQWTLNEFKSGEAWEYINKG